jgi:hypothetical protein
MKLCGFDVGLEHRIFLIAGPCVIESEQLQMDTAGTLKEITSALGIPFIFKSSFDKANRSSGTTFRGPGIDKGLEILAKVKRELGVPVLTDIHSEDQIAQVCSVVDVLQRLGLTFPISAPAVAAGVVAVSDLAYTAHVKAYNRAQMLAFSHELKDMGIRYLESNTNFLLLNFDGQTKTAKQAFDALYKNGIAGRMFNSDDYRNMLRITIGLEDEMRRTAAVLRAFIHGD